MADEQPVATPLASQPTPVPAPVVEAPPAPVGEPLPTQIDREDMLELQLFQQKIANCGLQMQLIQKDIAAINGDQSEYVVTKLKPKYQIGEGDGIDQSNGKILRKGDPNLTIGKPKLTAVPSSAPIKPAVMG